jgi:hypothetical protein
MQHTSNPHQDRRFTSPSAGLGIELQYVCAIRRSVTLPCSALLLYPTSFPALPVPLSLPACGTMFFDDEELSNSIFVGREEINNNQNSRPSCDDDLSAQQRRELSMIDHLNHPTQKQSFSDAYCSDTAIHSVLESTSMAYQYPIPIQTRPPFHPKPRIQPTADLLQQKLTRRAQAEWEYSNNVYCSHEGLDTILSTSSLAYSEPNPQTNLPIPPSPLIQQHDSYDDDEYLLAFGRAVNTAPQQDDKCEEEPFSGLESCHFNDGHSFFDLPNSSTVYLEGMDDFDVFSLFPPTDDGPV